jgi:hypothetical protein
MFSKKSSAFLLVLTLLSSCSWVKDLPKPQKAFESGELDLSCLQQMPVQLENLFAGNYQDNEKDRSSIKAIWKCLDRSLNSFSKYTHGSNDGYYTDRELRDFANRYLPKEDLFSDSLVDSIFRLKADVLGGNSTKITQYEIEQLRKKLNKFGDMILPLAPYISTLLKPFENLNDNRAQIAGQKLNQFVIDMADLLGDSEKTVTWKDLHYFVSELEKYLKSPNPTSLSVIREQIQIFQYLKLLVVGGDETGIEKSKWHPILKSISVIYNALYLTTSSQEMMEQLSIEIQSNDDEQRLATEKLTNILKTLKNDPTTYTKSTISLLADRWSKAMLLNSFLFPNKQDQLSIRNFFGSATIRKTTGYLIDEFGLVVKGDTSSELIGKMSDHLVDLIEQARKNETLPVNIQEMRNFASRLKILFNDESDFNSLDLTLSMLHDVSSIMIGKESGFLSTNDLRSLIEKANDLYRLWNKQSKIDFNDALSSSLDIVIRKPNSALIQMEQVKTLLKKAEELFMTMKFDSLPDWSKLNQMVDNGARLKGILFNTSPKNISYYEISQIIGTWKAFTEKKELDEALENLAHYFKKNPYSDVKVKSLLDAVDSFLPADKKLSTIGLDFELVGPLKAFLIGGQSTVLNKSEYSKAAQISYTVFRNLKPVLNRLPDHFKPGLNSQTIAIAESIIQGMIDGDDYQFSNGALKELLLSKLRLPGMSLKPETVDKLIIALNYRILDGKKDEKPKYFPETFPSSKLSGIRDFLELTRLDYEDIESAFSGRDSKTSMQGKEIYNRLTRKDSRAILTALHPILNGQTNMPFFIANGKPNTDYYIDDLYYKDLIYHALLWLLPKYEIESDPEKPGNLPRLTMADLLDLFNDINDAVFELGLSYSPDAAEPSAKRRMQSINVFTRTGNGDNHIDVFETIDFLTTTFAGKNLFDKVRNKLVQDCYPQNLSYKSQEQFSIACLKNHYFSKNGFDHFYGNIIPQMNEHYQSMNEEQRNSYRNSVMVAATTPDWKEDGQIDLDHLETLVSIPYYSENIFLRLDQNYNGMLTFSEAMRGFPVFCGEIKKAAGDSISGSCSPGEDPKQIEAIYGHLLMKGVPPRSIGPNDSLYQKFLIGKDFLAWVIKWKWMDKSPKVRDANPPFLYRKDLMSIIANLSTSITPVDNSAQPE